MSNRTVIVASKWDCGKGEYKYGRHLINNGEHNKHCCLGFDALARGIKDLDDQQMPSEYHGAYARDWKKDWNAEYQLEDAAIEINDDTAHKYTKRQRVDLLRPIFKAAGRVLVFVDDEGGK